MWQITLSLSSPDLECGDLVHTLVACGFPADVTANASIMKDGNLERGCRVQLQNPEHVPPVWRIVNEHHKGIQCAHLQMDAHYSGCIYDYLRASSCPGSK